MGNRQDIQVIFDLEERLEEVINRQHLGEYDGNEIGEGFCTLFMYCSDADFLFSGIETTLKTSNLINNMYIVKRYGQPGAREEIIRFNDNVYS